MASATYADVTHRKVRGTLTLSDKGISFAPSDATAGGGTAPSRLDLPWAAVEKHQVSPSSHPRSLLKVVTRPVDESAGGSKAASHTFQFAGRAALEAARGEVSGRLGAARGVGRRPRGSGGASAAPGGREGERRATPPSSHFVDHDPVASVAARSALLASDPALRAQHRLLVLQGGTLSEDDFWATHGRLVANEYARISGRTSRGTASDMKSSLDLGLSATSKKGGAGGAAAGGGVVRLGVEEMRQIFLMYPAGECRAS